MDTTVSAGKQININSKIPRWLHGIVDQEGLDKIEDTVARAEAHTAGEIVPMIVHRSIAIGHVKAIVFLVFLSVFWGLIPFLTTMTVIPFEYSTWAELGALVLAAVLAFPLASVDWIERLCTSSEDQIVSCERRALLEFYEAKIGTTMKQTGVLIFVSVLEHRAAILADKAIAERLPAEAWTDIINKLIDETKAGRFTEGMCAAIESAGKLLTEHFPLEVGDRNELGDKLVIKE